jgi:hypothetical protein
VVVRKGSSMMASVERNNDVARRVLAQAEYRGEGACRMERRRGGGSNWIGNGKIRGGTKKDAKGALDFFSATVCVEGSTGKSNAQPGTP